MSDANTKSGPLCHCISNGDESEFISYNTSGPEPVPYHKIDVQSGYGQHLRLPGATDIVVHVFNKWPLGSQKLWESSVFSQPGINDGDELKVEYYNVSAEDEQGWALYLNSGLIASGQIPTKL